MAYVRRRGSQLAIVHGNREPGTGKVQQRILFTIYSKAEAKEILGRGGKTGGVHFQGLFQLEFPDIKVNWKAIERGIEENMEVLPDLYEYRPERLRGRFREDLCAFSRQLMLADPQNLMSSAHLIQEHRQELEYLADLIQWRLKLCEQEESRWNKDNPFYWRFALQGRDVPPDTEEHASGFYERGEYDKAEAIFKLLIDCFDRYAEGHNYLGLIAFEQRRLDDAIAHFEKTIEVGRKLFPARLAKKHYWTDLSTRPYMRGLRNLALALTEVGRFDETLAICARLEGECGDDFHALSNRAVVFLNKGMWEEAADAARRSGGDLDPSAAFIEAFALFERGRIEKVLPAFLRAALQYPRAARMLAGMRTPAPKSRDEAQDHNTGASLLRSLHTYLKNQSRAAKRFFRAVVRDPRVVLLLDESIEIVRRWKQEHSTGERAAFDRMQLLRSRQFANAEARKLHDLIAPGAR